MADVGELARVGIEIQEHGGDATIRKLDQVSQAGTAAEKSAAALGRAQQEQGAMAERSAAQTAKAADAMLRQASAIEAARAAIKPLPDVAALQESGLSYGKAKGAVTSELAARRREFRDAFADTDMGDAAALQS